MLQSGLNKSGENYYVRFRSWIDLADPLTVFITGVLLGILAVVFVLDFSNRVHWIKYMPSVITAFAAFLGVVTWKKKISYERNMAIVDDFHSSVHDFILKISGSIKILELLDISIRSYEKTFEEGGYRQQNITCGLQKFVEVMGALYSSQIKSLLNEVPIKHVYLLTTKIYVLGMKDYASALNCYRQLEWIYDTLQKTSIKLGMTSACWENPVVQENMNELKILSIKEVRTCLSDANSFMLEFSRKNYK